MNFEPFSVRLSVHTHSNTNISVTSCPIASTFTEYYFGGDCLKAYVMRTLVSTAKDIVIMENVVATVAALFLSGSSLFLEITR